MIRIGGSAIKTIAGLLILWGFTACSGKKEEHQASQANTGQYKEVWSDEFNKAQIDTLKWSFAIGTGGNGWGNHELEFYTGRTENADIENGNLIITARKEKYQKQDYTSARMKTALKGDWTYGRVEARIKVPEGQGIWPAFWMMPTDSKYGGWPHSGEIDIMEMIGKDPATVYGTSHFGAKEHHSKGGKYTLTSGILHDDYHLYSIEWTPDQIKWFFDGKQYYDVTKDSLAPDPWPFDQRFYIILNVAVGGDWPGYPDSTSTFPQKMLVDYVRVYQEQ